MQQTEFSVLANDPVLKRRNAMFLHTNWVGPNNLVATKKIGAGASQYNLGTGHLGLTFHSPKYCVSDLAKESVPVYAKQVGTSRRR